MQENDRKQAKINSQNHMFCIVNKLEAQLAKPESPTCYFVLRKLYTEHSIGASYQISINLAKWFYRRFF
jgi:hypothetical protein